MKSINTTGWWQDTIFYEVYISSFQDGNGDGIGDFKGLTQRLDYLKSLGINGLWITPFYPSPKVDNGYDVANYVDVDPDFGSLADFDHFIHEAHQRDIKVIIDVVLNHVSSKHEWFQSAIIDSNSPYRDYFIFQDKPNNWESFFGGSAWTKEPNGQQYYYHKFAPEQVDLNWQNPAVKEELIKVLQFWLDRGVDGFRFDVINFLTCDGIGQNNPVDDKGEQQHLYDIDQPSILENIQLVVTSVKDYAKGLNKVPFLVGEVGHDKLEKLVPYQGRQLLDVVFNFNLGSVADFNIEYIYEQLVKMEDLHKGLPTLFFNSHDMPRSMSRLCQNNVDHAKALAALLLTAKGVSFLYFGEEIGMPDFMPADIEQICDVKALTHYELAKQQRLSDAEAFKKALDESRDKSRLYMQWDNSIYSGFSDTKPWIGDKCQQTMPSVCEQQLTSSSLWYWYRELLNLRRSTPALSRGSYQSLTLNNQLLTLKRQYQQTNVVVFINFNTESQTVYVDKPYKILASFGAQGVHAIKLQPFGVCIAEII